jgi:medium-chain acyl-[acyl-carrier-protein] hydrolase
MSIGGVTLLALAHAGGNAGSFLPLAGFLRGDIRMEALDLPGHGRRIAQPLLRSIPDLARDLLESLGPRLERPYAIFGHSMGALVGHALCQAAAQAARPLPCHLFVSGCSAPGHSGLSPDLPDRPAEQFWAEISGFGGLPQEVMAEPAILELFEPILRADLRAVADYRPRALLPLALPITVFSGDRDNLTQDSLEAWRDCSSLPVARHFFPGDHFFIFKNFPAVAAVINRL